MVLLTPSEGRQGKWYQYDGRQMNSLLGHLKVGLKYVLLSLPLVMLFIQQHDKKNGSRHSALL